MAGLWKHPPEIYVINIRDIYSGFNTAWKLSQNFSSARIHHQGKNKQMSHKNRKVSRGNKMLFPDHQALTFQCLITENTFANITDNSIVSYSPNFG